MPEQNAAHVTDTVASWPITPNAFFVQPGRCFRFVRGTGGKIGQPHHFPAA